MMENMTDMTGWVGIVVFLCGLYCLYAAAMMKTRGVINQTILLGKEARNKKCKDKEGFIKKMFPQLLLFGIVTTACGAADMINTYVVDIFMINTIMLGAFILEFLWFARVSMEARNKFY